MEEKFSLKDWLYIRKMTIVDLAKRAGITERSVQKYVSSVESLQQARYQTVKSIANVLGIKVDDIFLDPTSEKQKNLFKELEKIAQ